MVEELDAVVSVVSTDWTDSLYTSGIETRLSRVTQVNDGLDRNFTPASFAQVIRYFFRPWT